MNWLQESLELNSSIIVVDFNFNQHNYNWQLKKKFFFFSFFPQLILLIMNRVGWLVTS